MIAVDSSSCTPSAPERLFSLLVICNGTTAGGGAGIGGGDQVILKFIRLSGLKPDLILPVSAVPLVNPHGSLFLTLRTLGSGLLKLLATYLVRTVQGMMRARQAGSYDIALAASGIAVDLLPLGLCRARRKGVIIFHLLPERKAVNWATRIRFGLAAMEHWIAMRLVGVTCDFVVAGNDHTKTQLERVFPEKQVCVLHAGIDLDVMDRRPAEPRDRNLAVFMGRLTSQKGIFDLVDIMEQIVQTEPDFRLVMLGGGPERDALARTIQKRGMNRIELRGFVDENEKYDWLLRAGFFFFPSYEEGWGIALAEALYCGAVAICYELPHYKGIFGDLPTYCPLGDKKAFVQRFKQVRDQTASPLQRDRMRQYHDPLVVARLMEQLHRFASLPER